MNNQIIAELNCLVKEVDLQKEKISETFNVISNFWELESPTNLNQEIVTERGVHEAVVRATVAAQQFKMKIVELIESLKEQN